MLIQFRLLCGLGSAESINRKGGSKMNILRGVWVGLVLLMAGVCTGQENQDLEQVIIQSLQDRARECRTLRIEWEETQWACKGCEGTFESLAEGQQLLEMPLEDSSKILTYEMVWDGDSVKFVKEGPLWDPSVGDFLPGKEVEIVHAGKLVRYNSPRKRYKGGMGEIWSDGKPQWSMNVYNSAIKYGTGRNQFFDPARVQFASFYLSEDRPVWNDSECYVIKMKPGSGGGSAEIWLDPSLNFLPVRSLDTTSRRGADGNEPYHIDCQIFYKRSPAGIEISGWKWVLMYGSTIQRTIDAVVQSWEWNPAINIDTFEFEFPVYTMVVNEDQDVESPTRTYVLLEDGRKRYVTKEELMRVLSFDLDSIDELYYTETGMAGLLVTGIQGFRRKGILIGLVVLIFILIGVKVGSSRMNQ